MVRKALIPATLLFLLVLFFFSNIQRTWLLETNNRFKRADVIFGPVSGEIIKSDGIRFFENENLWLRLDSLADHDRFTVDMKIVFYRLNKLHFRFQGDPEPVDITLSVENSGLKPRTGSIEITLERYPDKVELIANGEKVTQQALSNHIFNCLLTEAFNTDMAIQSVRIYPPNGDPLFDANLTLHWFSGVRKILAALILTLAFVAVSHIGAKYYLKTTLTESLYKTIAMFSPLFIGSMLPLPNFTKSFIPGLIFCSVFLTARAWFLKPGYKKPHWIIFAFSLIGIYSIWRISLNTFEGLAGHLIAVFFIMLIFFYGIAAGRATSSKKSVWLQKAALPLLPVAFGALFALLWADHFQGLQSGFLFASIILLFTLSYEKRKEIPWYFVLMLLISSSLIITAEMGIRDSLMETRLRPMNTGRDYVQDKDLMYVPAGLLPNEMTLRIGNLKFRSGKASLEKAPGSLRVMTMGGSNCWGDGIDRNDQTFSGLLEQCLQDHNPDRSVELLNGGVKGFNLFQLSILFEKYGAAYKPDVLLLYININDGFELKGPYTFHELWEMKNSGKWDEVLNQLPKGEQEKIQNIGIPALQDHLRQFRLYNGLVKVITNLRKEQLEEVAERFDVVKLVNPPEDYRKNLEKIAGICRNNDITLVLADAFYIDYNFIDDTKSVKIREIMEEFAKENGFGYIPVNKDFHQRPDKEFLVFSHDRIHLNYKGHKVVSETLCDYLKHNIGKMK